MSSGQGNKLAADYIRENFEPSDRVAIVLVKKSEASVIQRLASARAVANADFQDWLLEGNRRGYEIYVSMNALHPAATGRTKRDVETIRHLYLDFDHDGTAAVERLLNRADLPKPNYQVSSSPGKWQVIWKVEGFAKPVAENMQRNFARQAGADPAATDCARVLRLPGYYNHKYGMPHLVVAERLSTETYRPERFPAFRLDDRRTPVKGIRRPPAVCTGLSQSERDWVFAKRALARGESPDVVAAAIAQYRRFDKHDPNYYAELTVRKAADALTADSRRETGPDRT